jgi:hypothetical protein
MAGVKRGDAAKGAWRETPPAADPAVVAPRFDELEEATARPVVPLGGTHNARPGSGIAAGTGTVGGFSLRSVSRHLVLAWAVLATLTAGTVALYRNAQADDPQAAPRPALESTADVATPAPQPARQVAPVAPARAAKMTEARVSSPSWDVPGWSDRENVKRDEKDEEELDERARKEDRQRRKDEKKRRKEYEEEAGRAFKEFRKLAERQRERLKDEGSKARLVGVITGQD